MGKRSEETIMAIETEWKDIEDFIEKKFNKKPDLQSILYLIGVNEYGHLPKRKRFSKEEKQDLIHVAVCSILIPLEYYMLEKLDENGWPHFIPVKSMDILSLNEQEELLKKSIILYFKNNKIL